MDHRTRAGAALSAQCRRHKIDLLRTRGKPPKPPVGKRISLQQARQLAERLKKVTAPDGLQDLTVAELKEMAGASGRSLG